MSVSPRPRRSLSACAVLSLAALLGACATASPAQKAGLRPGQSPAGEPAARIQPSVRGQSSSLYGLFLAGEAALDRGSSQDASRFLGRASELSPDAYLKERAFTAAVFAGDITRASTVQMTAGQGSVAVERLARLVKAVEALASNRGSQAFVLLKSQPAEGQTAQAVTLLTPWAAAAAGDWTAATAAPPTSAIQFAGGFANLGRARLLERAGRLDEAEAVLKPLTVGIDNPTFALGYGAFLERRGRRAEAVTLYDRVSAKAPDAELAQARARAAAGRGAPAMLSLQEGAGEALLTPAAQLIARRQPELGMALMRLALRLNPRLDEAWMAVGDVMGATGDPESAREAYAQVPASSTKYAQAQNRLAWSLQRTGDTQGALKIARDSLERSRDAPEALSLYADLLRENGRFEDAIAVLDRLIVRGGGDEPWRLYFMRGMAYERANRWDKAEPDLQQALKLNPAEPEVMNYLGFGWANRYQHLDQALELLQKAANLRPRSGEIRDSLGWAKYRLGRYPDAVRDLERAVQLAPAEPDINDHLGDAYWRVGRKLEAEFQWRRVLSLNPDDKLKLLAETKLRLGLDAASPPPASPSAVAVAGSRTAQP